MTIRPEPPEIDKARVVLREERRFYGPEQRQEVTCPDDMCSLLWTELFGECPREVFAVCMLNAANVVQTVVVVSEGTLDSSVVTPREVYQAALLDNAAAVICAHTHPSGNPEPSQADIRVTRQLKEAGEVMGIPLHDHLIVVGEGDYVSLAERDVA